MVGFLKRSKVGICAPSSPFDIKKFESGIDILESIEIDAKYNDGIFEHKGYLAGTDKRRADELIKTITDETLSAVMFARGGYGSQRIIPLLDATLLRKNKKPIIGSSDITPLLIFLMQECGFPVFYGPFVTGLKDTTPRTLTSLQRAINGTLNDLDIKSKKLTTLRSGKANGILVGGCLSMITSSMGTPYELKLPKNAVLFLEDTGEKLYAIDRMLTHLKNAGIFNKVSGIIFGTMISNVDNDAVNSTIFDVLHSFNGPIVANFPSGHTKDFITVPFNANVFIDSQQTGKTSVTIKNG